MAHLRSEMAGIRKRSVTGISVWKQHGSKAYLAYHNGLYRTGHNKGKLTTADIHAVTEATGGKVQTTGDHRDVLARTDALAQELGLTGTPRIIVMPVKNAMPGAITVFPGMATAEQLQAAIEKSQTVTFLPALRDQVQNAYRGYEQTFSSAAKIFIPTSLSHQEIPYEMKR